jgi:hypothetical protein
LRQRHWIGAAQSFVFIEKLNRSAVIRRICPAHHVNGWPLLPRVGTSATPSHSTTGYRIVANHVLNMKRCTAETQELTFASYVAQYVQEIELVSLTRSKSVEEDEVEYAREISASIDDERDPGFATGY